jgi:hypothetical protein
VICLLGLAPLELQIQGPVGGGAGEDHHPLVTLSSRWTTHKRPNCCSGILK